MDNVTPLLKLTDKQAERFWAKVDKTETCWIWQGATSRGYGAFGLNQKSTGAHRISYMMHVAMIDGDVHVDHKCFTRACVNPDHLRGVTPKANQEHRRGANRSSHTGVLGVGYRQRTRRYQVRVQHDKKIYIGGGYKTLEEARVAAIDLRNQLFTHNDADRRTP